jgi:uncharacterized protein (UPF0548 family)
VDKGLTYAEVGATLGAELPAGYHHLDERRRLGGPEVFGTVGDFVLGWGLQRDAGLRVPTSEPVSEGLDVRLRLGPITVPVRVVRVLAEPDRRGFVYGTLPGHPEAGEEAFLVERDAGGTWLRVRAFSRPARWYSRLGGPVTSWTQRRYTERYLAAGERAARQHL